MAISQKWRSLYCGFQAGLGLQVVDGKTVVLLTDVPLELEDIIYKWLMALPSETRMTMLHYDNDGKPALTSDGWDAFVTWMLQTLTAAQEGSQD